MSSHRPYRPALGIDKAPEELSKNNGSPYDHVAVLAAINRLMTQRGTAIGSGILMSLDAIFEESKATPTPSQRDSLTPFGQTPTPTPAPVPRGTFVPAVIVLLSDGVSNRGPRPLDIIEQATNRGVRIYTVGVGSPEGTVLRFDGFSIRVRLDEKTLRRIAEETDASYFKAESETDLSNIYENLSTRLVLNAEKTEITAGFTAFAALLLLFAGALSLLWFSRLP